MYENKPKYLQVYSAIKKDIRNQKYEAGAFLPTENELMNIYSTSKTTIRHAMSLLEAEKLVLIRQGRGTEVLSSHFHQGVRPKFSTTSSIDSRFLIEGSCETSSTDKIIDIIPAEIKVAKALALEIGTDVYRIQRIQCVNNLPYAYMINYIPCSLVPDLDKIAEPIKILYDFLEQHYNIHCTGSEEIIDAAVAGFMESRFLDVHIGKALLVLKRTAFYTDGILEYSETTINPDIQQLFITMNNIEN